VVEQVLDQQAQKCIVNVCQPGSNLLAAGYCMYSSSIIMVLSVGKGVYGFTLDPLLGEFILSHDDIKVPKAGAIYSFNEGNYQLWDEKLRKYIDDLKVPGPSGKPYSARYIGSLVGDFHRTLLYGGIYGYPPDKKSKNGKLRLLYECAPMSFLAEQAGGKGSDGYRRILDIQPEQVSPLAAAFFTSKSSHLFACHLLFSSIMIMHSLFEHMIPLPKKEVPFCLVYGSPLCLFCYIHLSLFVLLYTFVSVCFAIYICLCLFCYIHLSLFVLLYTFVFVSITFFLEHDPAYNCICLAYSI
jgi:hypothetical protein